MDLGVPAIWLLSGESSLSILGYGIVFLLGAFAGVLNVVAGGGSFLTLPLLIFLGLPPSLANGTNRVGIFFQNLFAVWSFQRHDVLDWRAWQWAAIPAGLGAPLGTWLALSIQEATFQKVLAFLMVGITLWTLWHPLGGRSETGNQLSRDQAVLAALGFFLIGIYGGFVQAGVGFLILSVTSALGFDLVRCNGIKVFTVLVFTGMALLFFVWHDKVHWLLGFVLAGGTIIGGLVGVKLTVIKGHEWVRHVVTVVVIVFALRLWFTA